MAKEMKMAIIINGMAAIQTVAPQLQLGEIQLSADRRSGKGEILTDAQRIRRIVLPSNFWGELSANMDNVRNQSLTDILRESLKKLGSDRLRDMLAETPTIKEVAINEFTIAKLLTWSEETATSRGSITFTREQAESWFTSSTTKQQLVNKWQAAGKDAAAVTSMTSFVSNRFGALAAKNHGIAKADDATKLMTMIAVEDTDNTVAVEIVGRLEHIIKTLTAKANEASISMDDL